MTSTDFSVFRGLGNSPQNRTRERTTKENTLKKAYAGRLRHWETYSALSV